MDGIKAQDLLILNSLLYSDLKKYIWISNSWEDHRDAQRLFDYMLKKKIYINGFATETKSLVNLKMFNKGIFDISTLDTETSAVFYDPYFRSTDIGTEKSGMHKVRIVNPDIRENVVIWGAGETGEHAYKILHGNKTAVRYFVDSNKNLEGKIKCGIPVFMPDKLDGMAEEVTVVEALEKWEELDASISEKIDRRFHYSLNKHKWNQWNSLTCIDKGIEKDIFNLGQWWSFGLFENRRVYIYGSGLAEHEFVKYLKLLDYEFAGFLVDENEYSCEEDDKGYQEKCVEEILYESNYYIWLYDIGKAKKLKELGLNYFEDYVNNKYAWDITLEKRIVLDVNLGFNCLVDSKYPGTVVYGDDRRENYKIAVLGNSTTDGMMYSFKSWPELLYKKLGKENVTVYNCGIGAYASGHELLKLIRDVLLLEPDMIVVYDGSGEMNIEDEHYPFAFNYMRMVFNYANTHMETQLDFIEGDMPTVCLGIESQKSMFENWLSNIQIMHAIAIEKGLKFYSFCAPILSSKEGKSEKEKSILLSFPSEKINNLIKQSFREYMRKASDIPDYIYDLSHIFDGHDDIYMDICHVWEKGNEIIAEEIKKIILPGIGASE